MAAFILRTTEEVRVTVKGRSYVFEGTLAGVAVKKDGKIVYVIEDNNGHLSIHSAKQINVSEGWLPT
jgi:hypothetical protein